MSQTQIAAARAGEITPAIETVARSEHLDPDFVRDEVAAGRIVIPANKHHDHLEPIGIGRALRTKINANIGNSALSSGRENELAKLECAVKYGADTVMDLSTGDRAEEIRRSIIAAAKVPVGTVPVYDALNRVQEPEDLTEDLLLQVIEEHARQGVDYQTLHAGLLREQIPAAAGRVLGIVSRGGSILATWMHKHGRENPLYTRFDDILAICAEHDVTLSLGDGMRPGCLADASDAAQFAELEVLAELVQRSREAGVQAMVEGPGHIPLDEIEMNMRKEAEMCDDAPFYILGPVVTDCAPGYDHITSSIGATLGAFYGAAMLCYVTPKEHLGLPNLDDVRRGVIAYRIAAHAADIALKRPHARERDDAISRARAEFDWEQQFELALDPEHARKLRAEALAEAGETQTCPESKSDDEADHCTMCGPRFCSMRLSRELNAEQKNG
jgi:phosphomethylpyrimidine synthase